MRERRLSPLLGPIESTDGGKTWRTISLAGVADFHVLRAVHRRIYGYDSTGGAIMVSEDGATWETRARLPVLDFVVSPDTPEVLVATTTSGVRRSHDGGRTWQPVSAPPLVLLSWETGDALWGVGADGTVYRAGDGGAGWERRGALPGRPAAFAATARALHAAVHEDGINLSEDGGATWRPRYRDATTGARHAPRSSTIEPQALVSALPGLAPA